MQAILDTRPAPGPIRPGRGRVTRLVRSRAGADATTARAAGAGAAEPGNPPIVARHALTYVGSRGLAAALNLASVAVFTRLAPVEDYGTYLYILSWAIVLYGCTCQWPKFAFFALYDEAREPAQVGTLVRILAGSAGLTGLGVLVAVLLGLVSARLAGAVVAVALSTTLFEGAVEVARTRLRAGAVAASVVTRAVLILGLGTGVLLATGNPVHLALALAAANALAALPAGLTTLHLVPGRGSRAEALRLFAYGWPLVLSFGTAALAASLDRLIIGRMVGPDELGAYGAIADFLKQSFVVFGEGLAFSLVSIAKREARRGGMAAAGPVLGDAARAMALVAAFGAAFFLSFDDVVVAILLGEDYRAQARALAPVLVVASILMMVRAYYFGQIIYFVRTSRLDAVSSLAMLAVVAGVSLALIPELGAMGAALAFAAGQGVGCLVFVVGGRAAGVGMPFPARDIGGIALAALATGGLVAGLGHLPGGESTVGQAARFALLVGGAGLTAWRIDALGLAAVLRARLRRTA